MATYNMYHHKNKATKFGDIKGVIGSHSSKKDRQYNDQNKMDKKTNRDPHRKLRTEKQQLQTEYAQK